MTDAGWPEPPADGDATSAPDGVRRTARPLLAVAWLVATVLAGVVTWSAVTVVAGPRGAEATGVVSEADVAARLAEAAATASPATGAPTPGATSAPEVTGPGATAPGTPSATDGRAGPTASSGPRVTDSSGATPDPQPAPAPAGQEVVRTWDVTGGQVAAACDGAAVRLLYATPADGWTMEVEGAGPQRVEVRLTREGSRSRVRAECVAGTPEMTRDGADDGGEDDGGAADDR